MEQWVKRSSELLSKQLNNEYYAYYFYTACSSYFDMTNVELTGLKKYFSKMAKEELDHGKGIVEFMNSRNLRISFLEIKSVSTDFKGIVDVFDQSIQFEEKVLKDITEIYKEAEDNNDYTITTFLDPYVIEQVRSIKELNTYKVNAERCTDPLGIYLFDQQFIKKRK
ncbi:hypothetical protein H311_04219 [Anncaliia algerae PRA109]|nr:hypothetical protein H311_04219 [Anncaliia algerae PRA109]